jgi:hypothetical protein
VAVNVGVYSDAACTLNLTSIDWGNVYPRGSVSRTIYVKNTGNVPMTFEHDVGIVKYHKKPDKDHVADCSITRES